MRVGRRGRLPIAGGEGDVIAQATEQEHLLKCCDRTGVPVGMRRLSVDDERAGNRSDSRRRSHRVGVPAGRQNPLPQQPRILVVERDVGHHAREVGTKVGRPAHRCRRLAQHGMAKPAQPQAQLHGRVQTGMVDRREPARRGECRTADREV
jgi:hypothetical protein